MEYLVVPCGDTSLQKLKDGSLSMRQALTARDGWVFEWPYDSRVPTASRPADFTTLVLPEEGVTLYP